MFVESYHQPNTQVTSYSFRPVNSGGSSKGQTLSISGIWTNNIFACNSVMADAGNVAFLTKDNTTAYTPSKDYHPATKKYVDDAIAALKAELTGGTE